MKENKTTKKIIGETMPLSEEVLCRLVRSENKTWKRRKKSLLRFISQARKFYEGG